MKQRIEASGECIEGFPRDDTLPSDRINLEEFMSLVGGISTDREVIEVADPLANLSEKELRRHQRRLNEIIHAQRSGEQLVLDLIHRRKF